MRTIIAGSRSVTDYSLLLKAIKDSGFDITTVISGAAPGADSLGEWYAQEHNILLEVYPAKWNLYGNSAGYIRNKEMADVADACIILWDGSSKGSLHMNNLAVEKGLRLYLCKLS